MGEENHYLSEQDWTTLMYAVEANEVVPFLGAGASHGYVKTAREIVEEWEGELKLPASFPRRLDQVAQFVRLDHSDSVTPKRVFVDKFIKDHKIPDFLEHSEPHGMLASLPLSCYLTTNYDKMMYEALLAHRKEPEIEVCAWDKLIRKRVASVFEDEDYEPSIQKPVVFHLHGCIDYPRSMVLTEDDYLDFLVELASKDNHEVSSSRLIPTPIQDALTMNTILFLGYSFNDINFRIIFSHFTKSFSEPGNTKFYLTVRWR